MKLWVAAGSANDMDLFVTIRKFAGPYNPTSEVGKPLEEVLGAGGVAMGNEIFFRGMHGHSYDMAARGQMRVSQRELDEKLSTPYSRFRSSRGRRSLNLGRSCPWRLRSCP